jgi:hypothetical protein
MLLDIIYNLIENYKLKAEEREEKNFFWQERINKLLSSLIKKRIQVSANI